MIVLTFLKPDSKAAEPTQQLRNDVLAVMQTSEDKSKKAKELLTNKNSTEEDQIEARKLLQESVDEAVKATQMQPKSPEAWYYLGQVYKQLIDINPQAAPFAEDAIKRSLELDPDNSRVHQELATVYILSNKFIEARETLLQAIKLDPKDANAYYKLGNVYKQLGEKEKAREAYLQAKKLTPESSQANNAMIDYQLKSLEK